MSNTSIFDVANYFLKIVDRDSGSTITPLKLQKILYYAQGYYLAKNNKPLFDEDFEAWAHGPANPNIYKKYKKYAYDTIPYPGEDVKNINADTAKFLDYIWDMFGIYDGKYLEELTHNEEPWINARKGYEPGEKCNVIIKKDDMKSFFKTEPYSI